MDYRTRTQIAADTAHSREILRDDHFDALVELAKACHGMTRGFRLKTRDLFDRLAEDFDDMTFTERDLYGADPIDGTQQLHDDAYERAVKELERVNPHAQWREPDAVRTILTP